MKKLSYRQSEVLRAMRAGVVIYEWIYSVWIHHPSSVKGHYLGSVSKPTMDALERRGLVHRDRMTRKPNMPAGTSAVYELTPDGKNAAL